MSQPDPIAIVQTGKNGDLCIMAPAFKAIYDHTGVRPVIFVAQEFSGILEGMSYVDVVPMQIVWWRDVGLAVRHARQLGFKTVIVPKFWEIPNCRPPLKRGEPTTTIKIHGRDIVLSASDWQSYQLAQWEFSGFTLKQFYDLPLVFDRRSAVREEAIRKQWFKTSKPKLLYNISRQEGNTSPFDYMPTVHHWMKQTDFELVDLSAIRAYRIYDLLGLYDGAAGLVTADTSTLHLAAASNIPYVAFIADGGSGSVPKGNCVLAVRYSQTMLKQNQIKSALQDIYHDHRRQSDSHTCEYARAGHPENAGSLASAR